MPGSWVPLTATEASGSAGWVKACPTLPGSWVPLTATWASGSSGWVKACPSLPGSWVPLTATEASGSSGWVRACPSLPDSWVPLTATEASGSAGWVKACPSLLGSWVPLTATWASGSAGWVKACPSLPVSWVPLATTGFWASGLFGLTSIGWGVVSSLVPTAIILFIGCFVIEVLITLLDCLPSTVVTSLNTICSPLIPSWTTLCCPLGKVASGCSTVSKATTSVVDLSSGLFSTGTFGSSTGVVLKSTEGVGVGCVGSNFGCVCFGKAPKSLRVKYPT